MPPLPRMLLRDQNPPRRAGASPASHTHGPPLRHTRFRSKAVAQRAAHGTNSWPSTVAHCCRRTGLVAPRPPAAFCCGDSRSIQHQPLPLQHPPQLRSCGSRREQLQASPLQGFCSGFRVSTLRESLSECPLQVRFAPLSFLSDAPHGNVAARVARHDGVLGAGGEGANRGVVAEQRRRCLRQQPC